MSETSGGPSPSGDGKPVINDRSTGSNQTKVKRRNRNSRLSRHPTRSVRYEGKCEQLRRNVYDITTIGTNTDLFSTTTKAIAEYIATEYDDAGKYRTGLMEMSLPELQAPKNVDSQDLMKFEVWKLDMRDFRDRQKKRNKNNAKAFALILGQCSQAIRDRIEAAATLQHYFSLTVTPEDMGNSLPTWRTNTPEETTGIPAPCQQPTICW
mmetsp:Transcript_4831/g.7343  ORF Transcript_4831/g.7343 Transcript_4831/m.7343 type:complete len:209 (-) Transcript_4831:157-783(-)